MASRKPIVVISGHLENLNTGTDIVDPASFSGTPDGTKFLRDDGSWQTLPNTNFFTVTASEDLAAGDFVNIHNSSGAKVRKANATTGTSMIQAHGFVLSAVSNTNTATVYFAGINNQVSGMTPGSVWLSTTGGAATGTAPSTTGNLMQEIGYAISATQIVFQPKIAVIV